MRVRLPHRFVGSLAALVLLGTSACGREEGVDEPGTGDGAAVVDRPDSRSGRATRDDIAAIGVPGGDTSVTTEAPGEPGDMGSGAPVDLDVASFCADVEATRGGLEQANTVVGANPRDELGRALRERVGDEQVGPVMDAEIVGFMITLTQKMIEEARFAMDQAARDEVRGYVQRTLSDHTRSLERIRTRLGSKPLLTRQSRLGALLADWSEKEAMSLRQTCGQDFDQRYIELEVEDHTSLLEMMDRLLMMAQSSALRCEFAKLRSVIFQHYQLARAIQVAEGEAMASDEVGEQAGEQGAQAGNEDDGGGMTSD
jgi:predicted outer membrane protein